MSLQTQGGLINNMSISSGILESQGTEQLQLASKVNEIKMLDEVDMGNKKIKNLATPTDAADATPKSYVDLLVGGVRFNGTLPTLAGQHLKFDDGTGFTCDKSSIVESGTELNLGSLKLVNMTNPTSNQDGATKSYVDTEILNLPNPVQNLVGSNVNEIAIYSDLNGDRIKQSGVFIGTDVDVNSKKITNMSNPVNATDAVNKQYLETELTNKITGPATSTNEGIAVYDGTTGKLVKNTDVIIFGANNCSGFNILGANQLTPTVGTKIDVLSNLDMINNSMIGNKIIINEIERNSSIPIPIIFNSGVDLGSNDMLGNKIIINEIERNSSIPLPIIFNNDVDLNGNDMIANIINVNEIKTSSLIPTPVTFSSDIDLGGNSILSSNNIFTGRLITPNLESNLSFLPINVLSTLTMNTKDILDVNGLQVNNLIPPNAPLAQEISVLCPLNLDNNKITLLGNPTVATDGANKGYVDSLLTSLPSTTRVRIPNTPDRPPTTGNAVYEDEYIRLGWDQATDNDLEIQTATGAPVYNSICWKVATIAEFRVDVATNNTTYTLNNFGFVGGQCMECKLAPYDNETAPAYHISIFFTESTAGTDDKLDWVITRYNI